MHDTPNSYPEENRARVNQGLLEAVMASCRDAIIACDLGGTIHAWNRGAATLYGLAEDEAIGANVQRLMPAACAREFDMLVDAAQRDEPIDHYDTSRLKCDGTEFPAAVCSFPLRVEGGAVSGFVMIERDVSERVRAAVALRGALTEAEKASSAKSRFLANASHELRTPMNAIVGMTALALEENLSPELRDYLETIRDSADAMLNLIGDVLDLSKFESDEFECEEIAFDLREMVEGAAKVLGAAAYAKGLELVCQVDPRVPASVVGDPVRLRQVLTNLLGNAIKFTAAGQVVVGVEVESLESGCCRLAVRVSDTGIGISPRDKERIFAPFTQVDAATTRRYSGTGLGLTISQHLIACFGSSLKVESSPGEGSCFSFNLTLPIDRQRADGSADEQQATERLRGLSVLVVDDNVASREALVEQFAAWGMKPASAESGKAALEMLAEASGASRPFDIAVIDALMPGVDGFSVASRIGGDDRIRTKPILMASATDRLEFSRRCAEAGAAGFVQKPISQSQLLGAVAQATGAVSLEGERRRGLFDRPRVQPLKVLLVEDTPANRKVVQRVLDRRGHKMEVAVNGREAVDAYRTGDYDVILMDVQMPIMDGFQATEAIREIERTSDHQPTPIIAMTAHSLRGDRERCLRAGMSGYLAKPLDLHEMIRMVETRTNGQNIDPLAAVEDAGMNGDQTLLDADAALKRLRGDRRLLVEMIDFYLDDAPSLVQEIEEATKSDQLTDAGRAAHSLKGLAATFDASHAVAAAWAVERACEEGRADDLPSQVQALVEATKQLSAALKQYREANAPG